MLRLSVPLLFAVLIGCGTASPPDPEVSLGANLASDEPKEETCSAYPAKFTPSPKAELLAREWLSEHFPKAELTWAQSRGTLALVTGLEAEAGACPPGEDVHGLAMKFAQEHSDLFQLAPEDWVPDLPLDCGQLQEGGAILGFQRTSFGGLPIRRDRISFFVEVTKERLIVKGAHGAYLPPAPPALAKEMSQCAEIDEGTQRALLLADSYPYAVLNRCNFIGEGVYRPSAKDTVEPLESAAWEWAETPGIELWLRRRAGLVVHPGNVTPEFLSSNANCPDEQNKPVVGFSVILDVARGEVLDRMPGIGCVVCLAPEGG